MRSLLRFEFSGYHPLEHGPGAEGRSVARLESMNPPAQRDQRGLKSLRRAILAWYDREARPFPWRERPSPYWTLVSEFMLQQTQVGTVLPYFEAFIQRFPDLRSLARAPEEAVLAAWSGLGYYRRARALKRVAETLLREHAGRLPEDPTALAGLPGFGPYTTAAVGSIALGLALPAVDGNVRRVLARWFAGQADENERSLERLAERVLDRRRPGDWNQALMELGATLCTRRGPRCLLCPARGFCRAERLGRAEDFPRARSAPALVRVSRVAVAARRRGALLVLQRGEEGAMAGLWELPALDSREVPSERLDPKNVLFRLTRLRARGFRLRGRARSVFTRYRIETVLYETQALQAGAVRRERHIAHRWVRPGALAELAAGKAEKRLFAIVAAPAGGAPVGDPPPRHKRSSRPRAPRRDRRSIIR